MKKVLLVCVFGLLLVAVSAFAEEPNYRMEMLNAQKVALTWEARYCQERLKVINNDFTEVSNEIMKIKMKEKKTKPEATNVKP